MGDGELPLLHRIDRAADERSLAVDLMDLGQSTTGAVAIGFYSMIDPRTPSEIHFRGLKDRFLDLYEMEGRASDPLFDWVCRHHVAKAARVDDLAKVSRGYRAFSNDVDFDGLARHMLAPIVVGGTVVGMMHFASRDEAAFDPAVVEFGAALSLHVSTRMAVLRALESVPASWDGALTAREREIAMLAMRGLSTAEIAQAATVSPNTIKKHLKRLYEKLDVKSRAELGMRLVRGPGDLELTKRARPRAHRSVDGGVPWFSY